MLEKERLHDAVDSIFRWKDDACMPAEIAAFQELVTKITGDMLRDLSSSLHARADMDRWGGRDGDEL